MIPTPTSQAPRILIADDQRDVLEALRLLLKGEGYQIDAVDSPAAALTALEQRDYDVVLIDLNYARDTTSGEEGLELLARIHAADDSLPVVVAGATNASWLPISSTTNGASFSARLWA